jgi:hypothetical protein
MATITSASTVEDQRAAYLDNLSYQTDSSVSKARAFVEACVALLMTLPKSIATGGTNADLNPELIQKQLEYAQRWLALNNTSSNGGSVRHLDFRNLRD